MADTLTEVDWPRRLDEVGVLAREADHRVGNSLQLVSSLLNTRSNHADTEAVRDAYRYAAAQVAAVAQLHSFLQSAPHDLDSKHGRVDLGRYLERLAHHLEETHRLDSVDRRLHVELQSFDVDAECARSVGLIVAELVANAVRHAFEPGKPANVWIRGSTRRSDHAFQLAIEDDGRGLPPQFDLRNRPSGLGLRFVSLLADQISARLTVDGCGSTRFMLTFPVSP